MTKPAPTSARPISAMVPVGNGKVNCGIARHQPVGIDSGTIGLKDGSVSDKIMKIRINRRKDAVLKYWQTAWIGDCA